MTSLRATSIVNGLDPLLTRERLRVYPLAIVGMYVFFWSIQAVGDPSGLLPDFRARWTAGAMVARGHTSDLYNPVVQSTIQRSEGAHSLSWFVSPPPVAVFFTSLGALPYAAAAILWLCISTCGLVIAGYLLRPYWPRNHGPYWSVVLISIASQPMLELVGAGQDSWLVLLAFIASWRLWLRSSLIGAGLALSIPALVKPQLLLPVLVLAVVYKCSRVLVGLILGGIAVTLASTIVLGPRIWLDWLRTISSSMFTNQVTLGQGYKSASLQGFLIAIVPAGDRGFAAQSGLVAGLALLTIWAAWLVRCHPSMPMAASTATFVAVLCAPHAMIYDLVITLPGIAVLIMHEHRPALRLACAGAFIAAWLGPPLSLLRFSVWPISALSAQWAVPILLILTLRQIGRGDADLTNQTAIGVATPEGASTSTAHICLEPPWAEQ